MAEIKSNPDWSRLLWGLGGLTAGTLLVENRIAQAKKSRAEIDDPEQVKEACHQISDLLEKWEPDEDCETEDDFTNDLALYLDYNTEWEIEVYPTTPEGQPDILVGDLLALELKLNPGKSERNRLIGQCAGYSRLWVTWAIIIGASESKIGRLVDLLEDKGLEQIAVWKI